MTASTSQDLPQIQHQCRAASGRDRLGGLATAGFILISVLLQPQRTL